MPAIGVAQLSEEHLRGSLLTSLLSVWVLVALFFYLNLYTKRRYFTVWMIAWLFYGLWLTMGLTYNSVESANKILFAIKESCVAISAASLLWGTSLFLEKPLPDRVVGLFFAFLITWTYTSAQLAPTRLEVQLPIYALLGAGSVFAGTGFYRLRRTKPFIGAGLLSFGFSLWGLYLASYPLWADYLDMYRPGFLLAAALQLFIAVSMIILVLEEARYHADLLKAEIATVRAEKEQLQARMLCVEEQYRTLYDRVRLTEGLQKAYEELRRTQQALVQQERLRALGQMASGIVHDISNSLTAVIMYTEFLLNKVPDLPDQARKFAQNIYKAANDISATLSRVRKFYKRESNGGTISPTNINKLIEEVIEITRPKWHDQAKQRGINIEIHRDLAPDIPLLQCDVAELRDGLINLIFNAVDALPHGGHIRVKTNLVTPNPSENGKPSAKLLCIEVADDGIGMDDETKQRCLEPFFTTKSQTGGTGLGLAMVYGMVQRHNGTIEIESEPGKGTSVRILLPIR